MKKIINIVTVPMLLLTLMISCASADNYKITGTSIQSRYEGGHVYMRPMGEKSDKTVDSCEILHGNFTMSGMVDSAMCVRLFFGEAGDNIPIILESGDIRISAGDNDIKVGGTPLNDRFYSFMNTRDSLIYILNYEIPHKESSMIMDGFDYDEVQRQLGEELADVRLAIDKLETKFVTDNYDNVLGITYFLMLCDYAYNMYGYATTTPQIDELYTKAPEKFQQNFEIQKYMQLCK